MRSVRTPAPARRLSGTLLKTEVIRVGDFVYCRSRRYREQLQLPQMSGLVIEIKRSNFKVLYPNDKRAWLPREILVRMKPDVDSSLLLRKLHFILKRVDAHECEIIPSEEANRLSARIDRIDADTVDELRAFLADDYLFLAVVPEGMAFMQLEIGFR